jgi:ribokinase
MFDLIGLGIASWDLIGIAASEPTIGQKQPLGRWLEAGGGPVATALVTAARLGLRCCMAGAVGSDVYGQHILADLQNEGIATDGIQVLPGTSHVAFVLAEPGRDRRSVWWHNDPTVLQAVTLRRELFTSARLLHLDTHMPEVALQAARWVHAAGGQVMIDAERLKDSTLALLPYCDYHVVSERFGREATGEAEAAVAARVLHERYGKTVVVTAGSKGSWCESANESFHTPAFPVEVVDTTGAGDVFHGGFLYGLVQGWPLPQVARFASATAALKCRAPGGRAGLPTLAEVEALVAGKH